MQRLSNLQKEVTRGRGWKGGHTERRERRWENSFNSIFAFLLIEMPSTKKNKKIKERQHAAVAVNGPGKCKQTFQVAPSDSWTLTAAQTNSSDKKINTVEDCRRETAPQGSRWDGWQQQHLDSKASFKRMLWLPMQDYSVIKYRRSVCFQASNNCSSFVLIIVQLSEHGASVAL